MTPNPHKHFTGPQIQKVLQLSGLDDSIREFYDVFMAAVEPDLVTKNIPLLEEKYANESAEDRRKRMIRYSHAYELFMAVFTHSVESWQADIDFYAHRAAMDAAEKLQAIDQKHLLDISNSLDAA